MTLGRASQEGDLFDTVSTYCANTLQETSIYTLLHREREHIFPDTFFEDLFDIKGRGSVPPSIVATVMVLQKLQGLSDREAVEHYTYDTRWRYAAGVGGYDGDGPDTFVHTVLVDMRARLRESGRPDRVFEVVRDIAGQAGLIGVRRVLDSTPLFDAVATMDTVTLLRSAIRGLVATAEHPKYGNAEIAHALRTAWTSGDAYQSNAKPQIDWEDADAREELIDTRARDAMACLGVLEERAACTPEIVQAGELLATVVGQDVETTDGGRFRIARRVAKDRIISTVDTDTRHGHKTKAHRFDGYKGHIAIDPDSEIITATTVTPGNAGDAAVVGELLSDVLTQDQEQDGAKTPSTVDGMAVYGDSAYGVGPVIQQLEQAGVQAMVKVQGPHAAHGLFTKDAFVVDMEHASVTCPQGERAVIRFGSKSPSLGVARFGKVCRGCPLREVCTTSHAGRTIHVGAYEQLLATTRDEQRDPGWKERYRAVRPKVERKIGHLMRRKHGARQSRVRGKERVTQDFSWLGAAANLARLARLRVRSAPDGGWECARSYV